MKFKKTAPPPCLREYVQYFWTLESDYADILPKVFSPLADGCPGLIFQPYAKGKFYQHSKLIPEVFLYGQTVKPIELFLHGKFDAIGICFFSHALKPIFGFNANEITDTCIDLRMNDGNNVVDRLVHSPTADDQVSILSTYLREQLNRNGKDDALTRVAVSQLIASKGMISLKELQDKYKISERSFERKFNEHVGITPKLYSRICRFQASLEQLKNDHYTNLFDIAFDNGFADQSHFIRTFKEFAGFSPLQFQQQPTTPVSNFALIK